MPNLEPKPIGFWRGWNTKASVKTLPEDSMSDAQNVQLVYGDLMKRKGSKKINTSAFASAAAVHGLADFQTAAGQRYMVMTAGTKIGQAADLATSMTDITGTATITSGANNQHTFASLNNLLIICGGTTPDTPLQWSGTGNVASLAGTPPVGNLVAVANNFAFISGISATPSRVFWSNVIDPGTWGSSNYVDFRISDGDRVTAMIEMDQNLIIFKRRAIGKLWTIPPNSLASTTLGPLTQIIVGIGCVGSQAVDKLPDGRIVFMGQNAHIYIFDGVDLEDISDPEPPLGSIQPTLDALPAGRLPNCSVRAYPTRNQVWVSVSTGSSSTNNAVYVYDTVLRAWCSVFIGIAANVMSTIIDTRASPTHPIVILTGDYGGFAYEQDTGTTNPEDANTVIDGWGTVSINLGKSSREYIPRSLIVPLEKQGSYNLEVNYGFDNYTEVNQNVAISQSGGDAVLDSFVLDTDKLASGATLRRQVLLNNSGNTSSVQIQFRNRQASQDFTVHPFYMSEEVLI